MHKEGEERKEVKQKFCNSQIQLPAPQFIYIQLPLSGTEPNLIGVKSTLIGVKSTLMKLCGKMSKVVIQGEGGREGGREGGAKLFSGGKLPVSNNRITNSNRRHGVISRAPSMSHLTNSHSPIPVSTAISTLHAWGKKVYFYRLI